MCVTSLLCGPRANLWPFYGFLWKRFSLYEGLPRLGTPAKLCIDVNESKRLSLIPSVSNLSLKPCRYLSTVTRSSGRGSVDGFNREGLQRLATFDSLSVLRRLDAR